MGRLGFVLALILSIAAGGAAAQKTPAGGEDRDRQGERILVFDSEIRVEEDGSVAVTETIRVVAQGRQIRRGIYRDLPTDYRLGWGGVRRVDLEILAVERNGRPEAWHTEDRSNGTRIYIGEAGRPLRPGVHNYRLRYRMTRQVGFFENRDEIYWNVTGDQWAFPIEAARVTVHPPGGAQISQGTGYTGPHGADERDFRIERNGAPWIARTTRRLAPGEGFTVAVGFDKGYVAAPAGLASVALFVGDYRLTLVALAGFVVLLLYYLGTWIRVGRDPLRGTIIPRFRPPDGFSPAACRYVMRMGYDRKAFAAAIIDMAVKGYLTIREAGPGRRPVYELQAVQGADARTLSPGEWAIARAWFTRGDTVRLEQGNHRKIAKGIKAFRAALNYDYEKGFFLLNRKQFFWGSGISAGALVLASLAGPNVGEAAFMGAWVLGWGLGCYAMVRAVGSSWRAGKRVAAFMLGLTLFPFFGALIAGLGMLAEEVSAVSSALIVGLLGINGLFFNLLKAPTRDGRRVMDEIEGFKMYLSVAERDRLAALHPPEKTPELFERFLPYAFALDVEQEWAEQFADVLTRAAAEPGAGYAPNWYVGRAGWRDSLPGFTNSLSGGLSGAISSSSSAPGSTSGSGGGGFSGGGGGGGGGGGW